MNIEDTDKVKSTDCIESVAHSKGKKNKYKFVIKNNQSQIYIINYND